MWFHLPETLTIFSVLDTEKKGIGPIDEAMILYEMLVNLFMHFKLMKY